MRLPLSDYVSNKRDERKHILFLGDLFTGTEDLLLTSLVKNLGEEYHCTYYPLPKGPRNAMGHVAHLCMSDCLKPDLIVACGTAATIACFKTAEQSHGFNISIDSIHAQEIDSIRKVLISPYFSTSNMIANMLPQKQFKTRIELPNLGKPEYLTLTRQMLMEYRQMEGEIYRQGIENAQALFFSSETDKPAYKDYVEHFGPAAVLSAENSFSPEALDCVARFIREILET
jgi:hypothetical protein